jgi:hypothetical protein
MILPSPMMPSDAHLHILNKKECDLYMRPESMGSMIDHIVQRREGLQILAAPALEDLHQHWKICYRTSPQNHLTTKSRGKRGGTTHG